ncbi:MAG: hypothetical protein ACKVOW_19050 [Chitinophagaceae bacterium]
MKLQIVRTRPIGELQQEFANQFPFLKIEFLRYSQPGSGKYRPATNLPSTLRVGYCQGKIVEGEMTLTEDTRVSELENNFRKDFFLNVQVFRKSGGVWLQTTMTDKWTLKQQNEHGKEIASENKKPLIDESTEYDLTRDANR